MKAYNAGRITEQKDKDIWNRHNDFKALSKMKDKAAKDEKKSKLQELYTKYVYVPALANVKKKIGKGKNENKI